MENEQKKFNDMDQLDEEKVLQNASSENMKKFMKQLLENFNKKN